ncbi:MAG TPA: hypothetical protein VK184_20465 [Nostocaceae cyanobacterium]|nr:hypothetical protein [Nostocaceae cyanobacterium]
MFAEENRQLESEDVQAPINEAPPEVKRIIERVCKLEKSRLDRKKKSHINDDILEIIKEEVQ